MIFLFLQGLGYKAEGLLEDEEKKEDFESGIYL
jgi:hypothetical protein